MKSMRSVIRIMALILAVVIAGSMAAYVIVIEKNKDAWLNRAANKRLREQREITLQGTVYDSVMTPVSWSDSVGTRSYISDAVTRIAMCHTVGDQKGMNSSGVEYRHATTLLGMESTLAEYTLETLKGDQPKGYDIVLTTNAELTAYLASQFPEGYNGAAVIINYKTGAILAKVSLPGYDPADMDAPVADGAYRDKVLQDTYAPGSTFKTMVLAAVLKNDSGIQDESFTCNGSWTLGSFSIKCAGNTTHGTLSLRDAYAKSCNVTFSSIAFQTGGYLLKQTAEDFGFNTVFSFSDVHVNPSSALENGFSDGEVIQAGIGQGSTRVTPLHMAMISGAIANGGVMMEPKLIKQTIKSNGESGKTMQSTVYKTVCDAEFSQTLAKYMYYAVQSGTGTKAQIPGYTSGYVCGKTGSAEWANNKEATTNAWYTGFLYGDDEHPYAIAVVVEKGGSGGSVAAPIASKALAKAIELGVY